MSNNLRDENTIPFLMLQHHVIDEKELFENAEEKMIYIILKRHANMDGSNAFPSIKTIAEKVPCSERTVTRRIENMVSRGLIRKEPRFSDDGKQTSNLYTITNWGSQTDRGRVSDCQGEGVRLADELYPFNYNPLNNATTTKQRDNSLIDQSYSKIQEVYMMAGWGIPNGIVAQRIQHDIEDFHATLIIHAIEIAAMRNAKGYGYAQKILKEWESNGLTTVEQVVKYEESKEIGRNKQRQRNGGRANGTNQDADYIEKFNQGIPW